jgi:hypothetical protein
MRNGSEHREGEIVMNIILFAVAVAGTCAEVDPDEVASRFHVGPDQARVNREFALASLEWFRGQHVIWANAFPAMDQQLQEFEWHFQVWDAVDSCVNPGQPWGYSRAAEAVRLKFLLGPDWYARKLPPPAPFGLFRDIDR